MIPKANPIADAMSPQRIQQYSYGVLPEVKERYLQLKTANAVQDAAAINAEWII
jgi:hypothetical protein